MSSNYSSEMAHEVMNGLARMREYQSFIVVGDVMVDHYITGVVTRISPEAPVPVFESKGVTRFPGGAANVAANLLALGAKVTLIGRIGDDNDGEYLRSYFSGVSDSTLIVVDGYTTERKTRYMAESNQIMRVDRTSSPNGNSIKAVNAVESALDNALADGDIDGVVVSDYSKGTISRGVARRARLISNKRRCYVDCKAKSLDLYRACEGSSTAPMTIKPNEYEFMGMFNGNIDNSGLAHFSRADAGYLYADEMLITRGKDGMTLVHDNLRSQHCLDSRARDVSSVIGAGDTALATYAWCRSSGMDAVSSAVVSNVACSEVVQRKYTATIDRNTLHHNVDDFIKDCVL